ncbi:MAG: GIY-YIG nuclease family protein, partial [Patescibacteria group bacterium]
QMRTVYILQNIKSGRYYIGSTNDKERRLSEHNRGQTKSTKRKGAWKIIHKEEYVSSVDAKKRERQIKAYKGGNAFKKLIGQ